MIITEDIIDTGKTMLVLLDSLKKLQPSKVVVTTLLWKELEMKRAVDADGKLIFGSFIC